MYLRKFHFYLWRFRNSSLPELKYRAKLFFLIKKLKIQLSKRKNPVVVPRIDFNNAKDLQLPTIRGEAGERLVKKILNGELFALNTDLTAIREIEDTWHNIYFG